MARKNKFTDQEREARRAEDRDRLAQAARALLDSEGWKRWVRTRATNGLSRYSLNNQMLVALQAPGATYVAGFKAWLGLRYCVRKGERALRILAPVPLRKRTTQNDSADADADEEGGERPRVTFKATAVFDRSQVDPLPDCEPTPLEPPCEPLTGDSHAHLLEPLRAFCADELGFSVEVRELSGSVGGWCDHAAREIVLDARVAPNAQLRTLIHESAHALGVSYRDYPRAQAEVIVDCTAYIVAASVGLDVGGESLPYVAGWGEEDSVEAVTRFAAVIDELAGRLEGVLAGDRAPARATPAGA